MACSMSSASAPLTSPTMSRSGLMRSELATSSRMPMAFPSDAAGLDSSLATWRWRNLNSAASSMVTIRSSFEM